MCSTFTSRLPQVEPPMNAWPYFLYTTPPFITNFKC